MFLKSLYPPKTGGSLTRITGVFLWIFFGLAASAAEPSRVAVPSKEFENANKAYEQGHYAEAVQRYDRILAAGRASAPLLFNLGDAYFQNRQPGFAIAAYLRALQLAPRDPDIRANLDLVRTKVGVARNESLLWQSISRLTLNEWAILSTLTTWLWFCLLTTRVITGGRGIPKWVTGVTGFFWIGVLVITVWIGGQLLTSEKGVIVVPEAAVRRGPLPESQTAFLLRDGTEVRVVERRDDWRRIEDSEKRSGWLRSDQVVVIKFL